MNHNSNIIADMHAASRRAIHIETPAQRAARLAQRDASILAAQNFIRNNGNHGNRHRDNIAADRLAATLLREQQSENRRRANYVGTGQTGRKSSKRKKRRVGSRKYKR